MSVNCPINIFYRERFRLFSYEQFKTPDADNLERRGEMEFLPLG